MIKLTLFCIFLHITFIHSFTYPNTSTIPYEFPLFKQCDERWGDDLIVDETLCQVGCLESSISMALRGTHILIINNPLIKIPSNPATLNQWLIANDGYDDENDLYESVVPEINPDRIVWPDDAMHTENDLSYETVQSYLDKGRIVILWVMNKEHFVLAIGYDEDKDTLYVNDPGFDTYFYSYSDDVVGYRIFDMDRLMD